MSDNDTSMKERRRRAGILYDGMMSRCYNHNSKEYKNYGGRGIVVCAEWLSSRQLFIAWAINQGYDPKYKLTLDRENNDGNYEPENCRFVDRFVQNNNRRSNIRITVNGEDLALKEATRRHSPVGYSTVYGRTRKGWTLEESIQLPPQKPFQHGGELKNHWKTPGHEHRPIYKKLKDIRKQHREGRRVYLPWIEDMESFYHWSLENGWQKGFELFKRDSRKRYSPRNCYWSAGKAATSARRGGIYVTVFGQEYTLYQAAEKFGVDANTIKRRIYRGETGDKIVRKPAAKKWC